MSETSSETIDWPSMLEAHRSWLMRVLRCRIGDQHAVEDAFQEIALAVVRQSGTIGSSTGENSFNRNGASKPSRLASSPLPQDPQKVAPWLYRVAVRQAVNFHRKSNRKSAPHPMSELETPASQAQPLDWLVAQEQRQYFEQAFDRLSAAQREILLLKYSERWSYQQLADHLGIPLRSVEYRLLQARKELRKNLKKVCLVDDHETD